MILDDIAATVPKRIERLAAGRSRDLLLAAARAARTPHDFEGAFRRAGAHVIAEIKFASPSAGRLRAEEPADNVAAGYLANGAAALSVLTEPEFFHGSEKFLEAVRGRFPQALLLQKDFLVDERQVPLARLQGADAILLIVRLLDDSRLRRFLALARELGLSALVEVHDEEELGRALAAGATLVGVNNRDLRTLKISLDVCRRLAPLIPPEVASVAESGISDGATIRELASLGYRGFLVGTSFMKAPDPGVALGEFLR